ncbi:conserved hypothetical protein [Leishmania mexicana MHOM/GT/2001/U1103]|uniref:Uncharacterized protein n=1 Tax=Leishmania mexicana (strain MHOM/GT/2001/U1103) TaxID=929439 RepID=E9B1U0_LEIMU|nr:conserved hypothetical protein [Leishmania mexicana MHOM/GT/2001/U1103]CBZ29197.1 conserved hypothetical protein [Leishmania mexicana MHOM/GT/2001/U1103]
MGLVPSRESLYETPAAASQPRALPFISRAAENYMYKTNRTGRVFGSGMALGSAGDARMPTALLNGVPTAELAHKIIEADPNAVFIEDPAEATAAVAASRGSRRGSAKSTEAQGRGRDAGTLALETPAAEALRQGRVPYVYYYEHRVLPLTTEFFPSPDCVLFRQLWHARKQQNPRYHFQLDHTWSPGALTDPTAVYESFTELATRNMADIQAACLSAGQPVTKENLAQARGQLQAAMRALSGGDGDMGHCAASSAGSQRTRVPFATREELYNLVVLTTKESMIYDTNQELRAAVCGVATSGEAMRKRTGNVDTAPAAGESGKAERHRQRLRPVPCAIVLVRRCMPAHEYRYIYFVANNERHHKTSAGAGGGSSRRRGPANACGTGEAHQPQQRESHSTLVCGGSVLAAVEESQLVDQTPPGKAGDDELTVPWVQVSAPQAPLGLAELRVVGMYGCWTVEEILRHTLFAPTVHTSSDPDGAAGTVAMQNSPARAAHVEKVLRRAAPHGVPSSTLVNTAFFEKQVGDKEQCHTYFALCRLFAHGMRRCILGDTPDKAAVTSTGDHAACEQTSADDEVPDESSQQTGETLTERQQADPAWRDFMGALSGGASAMSAFSDLANCFLIRFSNIPQLQLCRQIRRMLTELQGIYPAPPSLEGFQAAQRQRNMVTMSRRSGTGNGAGAGAGAGAGGAQGGDQRVHCSSPLKCRNDDEVTTVPPSLQGESEASRMDSAGASPSAVAETDVKQEHEGVAIAKRCGKSAVLPLSLDPEAIAERPHQLCERDRLERDGFCCYASHGLVVFRLSRVAVGRALNQLSFAPLHDSVEALCVTLTAAAPPPLTYRGELRPPARLRTHTMAAAAADVSGSGEDVADGDDKVRGGAVAGAEAHTPEALANMYNNAVRYSSSCATGFSMEPLWPIKLDSASWATHATALEDTPDELIGVLPRNSIEQRRGRLLPLRGIFMSEVAVAAASVACNGGAAYQGCSSGTSAPSQPHQQRHNQSSLSSTPACALFQVDVYTVSAELDGMPFRELVELMHQEQQQRCQSTAYGATLESTLRLMIESVDAQGNVEPDSVLNWSPMAALGSLRWKRALAAAGCGYAGPSGDRSDAGAEVTGMRSMSTLSANVPGSQGVVSIFVREPERILHTGDRIRFAPHRGGSPNSGERNSPMDAPGSGTPHTRSRGGGNATSGTSQYGYWYVDDNLTTEDMILSWMRRVGGRARETCGTDTKWVRFPEPVLQVLLRFAHTCRQQPGGGWLITGHALPPLHPADEELVEPDLLQNYPDILRTRRFRQWRFSHDGYVYFHGVTVRIPGSSPLPSHPPPAAAMTASAYHAAIHNRAEMTFGMCGRRSPGAAVVSSARAVFEPPQQQSVVPQHSSVMQYGEELPLSDVMPHSGSGEGGGGQYGAGAATGGPAYYANQAMHPLMGGSGRVLGKHYDPSMASQQLDPHLSALPQQQQFSQHVPQQYPPQHRSQKKQHVAGASLHHTVQQQQTMPQPPQQQQQQHRGPGYGPAGLYGDCAGPEAHYASTDHFSMVGGSEQETMPSGYYGDSSSSAVEGAGRVRPATPNTVNGLYFNDADPLQSNAAATSSSSSHRQPECQPRGYHGHHADGVSFSEGMPSGGAGFFIDYPDGTFYHSWDRAHSASTIVVPAQVTSSFYGGIYNPSVEQLPHTPQQQQQQRYRSQAHSPFNGCEPASGHASGPRHMDNTLLSYGLPPNVSGIVPPGEEVPNPSMAVGGCGRDQEEATSSSSEPSMIHVASGNQQHQQHPRHQSHSSMLPPPSAPAPPPPPQQQEQVNLSLHGEGDRAGHASERRTTDDYPPRRSSTIILATTAMTVSAVKPTSQKLIIQTLRGTRPTVGHRAPPVASFAPDVVDTSPLSSGGGNTRPVMTPKDCTAERLHSGADTVCDGSMPSRPARARAVPVCDPDLPSATQQMRIGTQHVYQQPPQQQQQPAQQAQAPPPCSPQLASGPGSFRDTITADVIEADSITVRVIQRKSSMARQSSHNGATGGAAASGYRTGSGAFGNLSNAAGDGGAPDAFSASPIGYGAMGVSPSGGLESMRDEANSIHRQTGGVSANDSRAAPDLRSYRLSQMRTSTTGQHVASGRSTAAVFEAPRLQHQTSMMGSSSPTRRTSQRMSHNPYTTAGSLYVTPLSAAAGLSIHSQGGAGGCRAGSNGPQDSFTDALDNRYGSVSDFNGSVAAFPLSLAHNANGMPHGTCYSRCAGDPTGFRGSPATSQRPSLYPSQRAACDVDDSARAEQQREGRHESFASFYDGAEDAPTSTRYSDSYQNAAADGTTQGFFFSMGDYEETGHSAEELYGGGPGYPCQSAESRVLQLEGRTVTGAGRGGSAYGGVPLRTRSMHHHHQLQQRHVGGGSACNGDAYESSTPSSVLPHSSQTQHQHAYSPTSPAFQRH